jgi:hypothetical protein
MSGEGAIIMIMEKIIMMRVCVVNVWYEWFGNMLVLVF